MVKAPKILQTSTNDQMAVSRLENGSEDKATPESIEPITSEELASLALEAPTTNGMVTAIYSSRTMGVNLGLQEMMLELNRQVMKAQKGNRKQTESMLISQAITLNAIFTEMARRAAMNMNQHPQATELYMRMALRAQNQSRATLETLSAIKNPPVVIAKQANISAGLQQVNNVLVDARASEIQNPPIQVSGEAVELHQIPSTSCHESRANSTLEALGTINRP